MKRADTLQEVHGIYAAQNCKAYRECANWSMRDLSRESGVSVSSISRLESGKDASMETLVRLAKTFCITLDLLILKEPEVCSKCGKPNDPR